MSGTTAFRPVVDDLLTEAWERCGKDPAEMTGAIAVSGRRSLFLALVKWATISPRLWQIEEVTLTSTAAQAWIQLAADTVDILEASVSTSGIDRTIAPLGRDEYAAIAQKASVGEPSQFWVQRGTPTDPLGTPAAGPLMWLYPVSASAVTVKVNRIRQPYDVSSLTENADIPVLWSEALCAELAARLAQKFVPERQADLRQDAASAYAAASRESRERVPLSIMPRMR